MEGESEKNSPYATFRYRNVECGVPADTLHVLIESAGPEHAHALDLTCHRVDILPFSRTLRRLYYGGTHADRGPRVALHATATAADAAVAP